MVPRLAKQCLLSGDPGEDHPPGWAGVDTKGCETLESFQPLRWESSSFAENVPEEGNHHLRNAEETAACEELESF